ncbi:transcriptional regulator [Sinorhizobium fredii USDA 205]|uniref:Response regulator n=1 Tax=Rhizobium fredii TaxID=380 RepID=A0A844ABD7_RHIFR|nr:response regulator [Sinorhizobium fredii]ASY72670.1 putative two-component response regulator protein [Sinorhizobium fredii CCBAU 83666]AWM28811.1 putative two-component response regulator protein [Sinorhizobium fredii CCBAU 25509]KSV83447.1 transcriptional regulator [Sinorhizobium fredii USDA 205]MCG5473775.1 response regulator [Sinorhizobium fredii]MQW97146.1 response regulator [Sinorhizobium fredii]
MTAAQPCRVFVVEDEFLVALQIEDDLIAAGYLVVGPFTSLSTSIAASRAETFDVATLDLNLRGEFVYPLVDELLERHVPVLLLTGYAGSDLPERFRCLPRLTKPFDGSELISRIKSMVPAV